VRKNGKEKNNQRKVHSTEKGVAKRDMLEKEREKKELAFRRPEKLMK